jgi:hypothetical protein
MTSPDWRWPGRAGKMTPTIRRCNRSVRHKGVGRRNLQGPCVAGRISANPGRDHRRWTTC